MAKITTIRVSLGMTRNAGNYESVRLEQSVEAVLDEGESATEAIDKCNAYLETKVKEDTDAMVKKFKAQRR